MLPPTKNKLDLLASKITLWIGSPLSMVVHTLFFIGTLALVLVGFNLTQVLLVLTTIVSLEAIYLSIFIQYSVNQHTKTLTEVAEDIEDVTEDVEEISKDVEEISTDVEDISENLEELQTDAEAETNTTSYEKLEEQLHTLLEEVKYLKERNNNISHTH